MISFILPIKSRPENLSKILINSNKVFKKIKFEIIVVDASSNKIAKLNQKSLKDIKM